MSEKAVAKKGKPKAGSRMKSFFRSVWAELKKVHWPTKHQVLVYTGVVLSTIFAIALAIWVVDSLLSFLMGFLL